MTEVLGGRQPTYAWKPKKEEGRGRKKGGGEKREGKEKQRNVTLQSLYKLKVTKGSLQE